MTTQVSDVPDWIVEVIQKLAEAESISLEQASRLLLYHGATYYAERLKEKQGD